jgi:hypothetical protein
MLSYHMITLILFSHLTFCKIVQLSSHMILSVIFKIINSCIYLGGAHCTNLENKTLLCLLVEKLSVCHQSPKRGRFKVHLGPRVGFGRLMTNN